MDYDNVEKQNIPPGSLNEIYAELIDLVGTENMIIIYTHFKGQQISYPVNLCSREYTAKRIKEEYNGSNISSLAAKYGYSERWVRKIIKEK